MVIKIKRGDSNSVNNYTPASGELVFDQTNNILKIGDGVTQGGKPLLTSGFVVENFTATSNQTTFTCQNTINSNTIVIVDGIVQIENYSINNNSIIFNSGLDENSKVLVISTKEVYIPTKHQVFIAEENQKDFTVDINKNVINIDTTQVFLNGILLVPKEDYDIINQTVSLKNGCNKDDRIVIK